MMERNQNTFLRKVAKIDWEAAWRNFLSWEGFRKQPGYICVEIHQVVYLRIQWFTVQYKFHLQKPPINKLHIMKHLGLKYTGVCSFPCDASEPPERTDGETTWRTERVNVNTQLHGAYRTMLTAEPTSLSAFVCLKIKNKMLKNSISSCIH